MDSLLLNIGVRADILILRAPQIGVSAAIATLFGPYEVLLHAPFNIVLTDVLIIGGGLSGLHTAYELFKRKIDFILIEARDRLGGRILSLNAASSIYRAAEPAFDLGPAWFWPGQERMENLVKELGLSTDTFKQFDQGQSIYEDDQTLHRGVPGLSMGGAYRLNGGVSQMIAALRHGMPGADLLRGAQALQLTNAGEHVQTIALRAGQHLTITSRMAVLALPPRLAMQALQFTPALSASRLSELNEIATWMAGHAKFVAAYAEPIWRDQGFSGDVISQRGPLGEIHDASPQFGGPYALFGFLSVPSAQRRDRSADLKEAAIAQLSRYFGDEMLTPLAVSMKDWASDVFTSTESDQQAAAYHSFSSMQEFVEPDWGQKILWSGSETAGPLGRNNGYLEGALESSIRTLGLIERQLSNGAV